jgi:hypothetical protein
MRVRAETAREGGARGTTTRGPADVVRHEGEAIEETGEMAKTLGLGNGGEAGSIYQALVQVSALVDNEIKATRNIVDPPENR